MDKTKSHNTLEVVSEMKNPAIPSGIFHYQHWFSDSKQLQLLAWCVYRLRLAITENLHLTKLFVGDTQDADVAKLRHERLHPLDVDFSILTAWAMSQIDGKLKHRETISHDALAEIGVGFPLLLRFRRQIEKHQHPHNSVFTETIHHISIVG